MDTILLVIGVVGLSISGWVLRGYFLPPTYPMQQLPAQEAGSSLNREDSEAEPATNYISSEEHQLVLQRLDQLERVGLAPKVTQNGSLTNGHRTGADPDDVQVTDELSTSDLPRDLNAAKDDVWEELLALRQAYEVQREKERDTDYGREETLFDLSESHNGISPNQLTDQGTSDEDELNQRLLDNQLEEGEELNQYHQRMNYFATLSKDMLVMRLEVAETRLREQQEKHQAYLLSIIASLIEKVPSDINLKHVAQTSFVAASKEISDEDGQTNRENFQAMFYQNIKQ